MSTVRVATRGSDLALWQARHVAAAIEARLGATCEIVPLKTTGDRLAGSLAKVGGKGLFVKEIEEALLEGRADVAVHSAKDLPAEAHADLVFAAFPERADPRDALVGRAPDTTLASLRSGARVGTGSVRRTAQLLRARPDLEVVPLRGNVPTRLARLEGDELDAVVLACAGLDRLGYADRISQRIPSDALLPAVAQGALAIQARRDTPLAADLAALSHAGSVCRVRAERAFLSALGGDCNVPIAALATLEGERLVLEGLVISPDGRTAAAARDTSGSDDAEGLGARVAERVLAEGARGILDALREGDAS
ncbi:MAG: hydroxymethylbilane synthase [Myxococcota bacterium]